MSRDLAKGEDVNVRTISITAAEEPVEDRGMATLWRRLLSGGMWAFAGRVVAAFTVLATNALLARLLPPQDLGAYFLAFSVVSLGALLGSLGLNQTVVRFVAESMGLGRFRQTRWVVGITCGLGLLGALGVGLAYLLLGRTVGNALFDAPVLGAATGLVAGWMAILTLQLLLAETFRGFNDIRLATLFGGIVAGNLLLVCLVALWLSRGEASLADVVLLTAASGLVSILLGGWLLHRKVASLPRKGEDAGGRTGTSKILRVAGPLLVTNLTYFAVLQADLWIMGAFRTQDEVAIYGSAARMVVMVALSLDVVDSVVAPLIAEMYAQDRKQELERALRGTATLAGIPALAGLAGFMLLGEQILGLVFGDYYRAGWGVLVILSLGYIAFVWTGSCALALIMTGHQREVMGATIASGLVTVAAGLAVVGPFGAVGVATVTAFAFALQNVLLWILARKKTGIWTHFDVVRLAALAGARFGAKT